MKVKKKSVFLRLLPWALILAALAALVVFVGIPLYAPVQEEAGEQPVIEYYEGGKNELVLENEELRFALDPVTTQFVVTEKDSGREWRSNPEKASSDPVANASNKDVLQSTLLVTYATSSGVIDLNNYKYSIQNGVYTIDELEDAIQVNYTVGKVEKVYRIPSAITVERYKAFTEQMDKKTQKKISGNYSLYEPSKLDKKENKDEVIALYPEVVNQPLYILKADTSANNKENIEGYFEAVGYTDEDYEIDQQLVAGASSKDTAVFNVSVIYRLDGGDLVVEVPYDKIRYRKDYSITYVTLLPMFGATGTDEDGFMLVPEGGGALIRYNNGKLSQSSYYANLYGWDYGTERTEVVSETCNAYPMFGMTHDGGSFICVMEGATSYGGIQADISGRYNSYNWMCAKYNVLHFDRYNVSAKTPEIVYMFEKQIPNDTIVQRYRFVESDRYVDMAKAYGEYLRETTPLTAGAASEDVPVSVELVMAIDKTVEKFGLPVDSVVANTTFQQAGEIMDELLQIGTANLNLRLSGWCNGGITQKALTDVDVERGIGGEKGMKALIEDAKQKNVPLYFDGITCFAYDNSAFDGFSPFRDAARFTTREQIEIYPYSKITYQPSDWLDPFYLVRPDYAKENAANLIQALSDMNAAGIAFRDIGSLLSGNYNPRGTTTREETKAMNLDTVREAKAADMKVMVKKGYDYALTVSDIVTDMNLTGTPYALLDESVPVYQIAFHGAKDYTGGSVNLSGDYVNEILKCAEYGAGLNFTFMAKDAKILENTTHNHLRGAYYAVWADEAKEMIQKYQKDMAGLNRLSIVDHAYRAEQLTVTEYEDGTRVYVNYGDADRAADGITVPARSYLVKGGN